ncbi:MAG: hypothetical protein QHH02_05375 [Syntrophomonadaceae bacterium]|nr:hypothetical protein [Syntrophomonadaceae bacterium]
MKLRSVLKARYLVGLLLLTALVLGCRAVTAPPQTYCFSFEKDLEGWQPAGTDLDNPPVRWFIKRSSEQSRDGRYAAKFYLNNLNDMAKIWMQRGFPVKPGRIYRVKVDYTFASADWGNLNLWQIIAGAAPYPPQASADLVFQEDTGNGSPRNSGYVWLDKSYQFRTESSPGGELYVYLGVWGTWETPRIYYLDSVKVTISEEWKSIFKFLTL